MQAEANEFDDPDYAAEFRDVVHVGLGAVQVTMPDGSVWRARRDTKYYEAPELERNGVHVRNINALGCYSPALSAVRWLLMAYRQGAAEGLQW